ncbi:hypothetical protein BDR05DRAFT_1005227 [Suillus weaverae]|nr:hypothetical protein BDR05DRAFT_1005227 [Suillus weaverae]
MPSADDAPLQVETSEAYFNNGLADDTSFWEFDKMLETLAQSTLSMSMCMSSNPPPNVLSDQEVVNVSSDQEADSPAFPSWTLQVCAAGMEQNYAVFPSVNTLHGQEQLSSIDTHEQIIPSINSPHGQVLPSIDSSAGPEQLPSINMHEQILPSINGPPGQVELSSIDTSHVAHVENESCLYHTG